jgi:hypothetical protein
MMIEKVGIGTAPFILLFAEVLGAESIGQLERPTRHTLVDRETTDDD